MLTRHHHDLWTSRQHLKLFGVEVGARMTAIRLADGGLVVIAPIGPIADLGLSEIGPVVAIIAPNRFHHLYVRRAVEAFPDARTFAAPGLPEKRTDLRFDEVLGDEPPALWRGQLEQVVLRAAPSLNEVLFFHPPSRTLVATDLVFNIQHPASFWGRTVLRLYGVWHRFGPSRLVRAAIRDRAAARATLDTILGWQPDLIVVAHGEVLETGGTDALQRAFAWL